MGDGQIGSVIYLFGPSFEDKRLRDNLAGFGYEPIFCCSAEDLLRRVSGNSPDVLLVDADEIGPGMGPSPIGIIQGIQDAAKLRLPVIFVSSRDTIELRLSAVRAGGEAFFLKPWNITQLTDKIESLTKDVSREPFRVLIVDDDPNLSLYHSVLLKTAGMTTDIVNNPFQVCAKLIDFLPDLILMDVHMPGCNGEELARVIRQMRSFDCVPIVFLSAEKDTDKQLAAMSMGGDDFMTKPVVPHHLIASVSTRAERMRLIRSFMDRDSLTGLLNHSKTKEQLDIALASAKRQKSTLSFAMIDIDHFKRINDTYGHPVGDTVIVTLSRLLQQRMRKSDVVGRYGGEEFAVVVEGADGHTAFAIIDEVRSAFAKIEHRSDAEVFTSTFSCGIASFPPWEKSTTICNAADKALYDAKHAGRNRTVVS
jgi:diguanylate cyclase (GGDEF)-like protein